MKDRKEFFELYGNKSVAIVVCQPCPRSYSILLITTIATSTFLHFVNSVRKFFHSWVGLNPKNDVIKSSIGEIQKNVYAIYCDLQTLCDAWNCLIQIYDERSTTKAENSILAECNQHCWFAWTVSMNKLASNWRSKDFQVVQWCDELKVDTKLHQHILQLTSVKVLISVDYSIAWTSWNFA